MKHGIEMASEIIQMRSAISDRGLLFNAFLNNIIELTACAHLIAVKSTDALSSDAD